MRALESARRAGAEHVLMLLDEPTVYLGPGQREVLFALVRRLIAQGDSAIFISHRLQEVLDLCDRVSVLRDGRRVSTHETASITAPQLVQDMLGYSVDQFYPDPEATESPEPVLRLQGIRCGQLRSLSLSIAAGEIVGVTGVPGSGVDDLPHLLCGDQRAESGVVEVFGEDMTRSLTARSGRGRGIVVVPADRHRDAVWLEGTGSENLTLGSVGQFFSGGRLRYASERRYAKSALVQYGVRPPEPDRYLRTFSGGNQQKIVLARALEARPKILVLHEATQGVDAGGKKDILDLVSSAARSGVAVVMSSTDYEELAHVCHRVLVLREGAVAAQLSAPAITEDALSRAVQL
jgi:ribose transport system ATP-binding protein